MNPRSIFDALAESDAPFRVSPPEEQSPEDERWDRDQIDLANEAIVDWRHSRALRARDISHCVDRLCIAGHHVSAPESSVSTYCDGCRRSAELVPEHGPERAAHLDRLAREQREIAAWWRAQSDEASARVCDAEAERFERMAGLAIAEAAEEE